MRLTKLVSQFQDKFSSLGVKRVRLLPWRLSWKVTLAAWVIFILFSLPTRAVESVREANLFLRILLSDAMGHFVSYGGLAFVAWLDYGRQKASALENWRIFLYCFLYSFFIEVYQILLPWRSFEFKDLLINAAGIFFSLLITSLF